MKTDKKDKHSFLLKSVSEVIEYFSEYEEFFSIRATNYSVSVDASGEKYFFSDSPGSVMPFVFFNKMKKDVGGEYREVPSKVSYFDFKGMKKGIPSECYSVDLNSAYLRALINEGVISEETFQYIQEKSTKSKAAKMDRLKAVGMFASSPVEFDFENGIQKRFEIKESPFSWVFFTACQKVGEAMEIVKKKMGKEYILYWVDGIFLRGNPDKAVKLFEELGFPCKIERITNLRNSENGVSYDKDGEPKILYLPRSNKEEISDFRKMSRKTL